MKEVRGPREVRPVAAMDRFVDTVRASFRSVRDLGLVSPSRPRESGVTRKAVHPVWLRISRKLRGCPDGG